MLCVCVHAVMFACAQGLPCFQQTSARTASQLAAVGAGSECFQGVLASVGRSVSLQLTPAMFACSSVSGCHIPVSSF